MCSVVYLSMGDEPPHPSHFTRGLCDFWSRSPGGVILGYGVVGYVWVRGPDGVVVRYGTLGLEVRSGISVFETVWVLEPDRVIWVLVRPGYLALRSV